MKTILINLLNIYQNIFSPALHQLLGISNNACRFSVTCSENAKIQINKFGVIKGGLLSITRVLKCQPFYNKA